MATMNVSLPDLMRDWVEQQVATGRYSNASDYIRDLIRRDQERNDPLYANEELERPETIAMNLLRRGPITRAELVEALKAGQQRYDRPQWTITFLEKQGAEIGIEKQPNGETIYELISEKDYVPKAYVRPPRPYQKRS